MDPVIEPVIIPVTDLDALAAFGDQQVNANLNPSVPSTSIDSLLQKINDLEQKLSVLESNKNNL
jgi:hypothetical protein